jgi:hypothetical protein
MSDTLVLILFLLPPILGLACCFIRDAKKRRGQIINTVLILNSVIYLAPLAFAFFATPKGGNMWSENGPGAILWFYMIFLPICGLAFVVLVILKLVLRKRKKDRANNSIYPNRSHRK